MSSGLIMFTNYFGYTNIPLNLLWLNYLHLSLRIFMITSKYAVIDKDYLKAIKRERFSGYRIASNLTMMGWKL